MNDYNNMTEEQTVRMSSPGVGNNMVHDNDFDQNLYTMGAQAYYTEAMSQLRNNRHNTIDESILDKIDQTSKKIADKYGYESKEYRKFLEKLKEYENKTDELQRLARDNKIRSIIIKSLCGASVVALIIGVFFLFNTNTFYANQGQYNYIYKRNLIGSVELFKQVPCRSITKSGNKLYYINIDDNLMYHVSAKTGEEETQICNDAAQHLEVIDGYIYYINASDVNKLYRIRTDGSGRECIFEESCLQISDDKKYLEVVSANDPENPLLYNTKTGSMQDALIK